MTAYPESRKYGATLTQSVVPNTVKTSSRQGGNRMTEVTEVAKQCVTQVLGELAGQFRVEARPCHFEVSVLADATAAVTIRAAGPCVDLNEAHRAVAGMPGLIYLTINGPELWAYVNAGALA